MHPPSHILIVDDDDQSRPLKQYLEQEGFEVYTACNGRAMHDIMQRKPIDLIVMELLLTDEDGLSLTRHLREQSQIGIIHLTHKQALVDRIVGLELGADDYLVKPCEHRELLARIRSVLRRSQPPVSIATERQSRSKVRFADWYLDFDTRQLHSPVRPETHLTTGEFDLLSVFIDHSKRVLTRDQLMDQVHHRDNSPFDRCIDVQVGRLRRKIEPESGRPQLIQTVRGVGYVFTPGIEPVGTEDPSIRSSVQ